MSAQRNRPRDLVNKKARRNYEIMETVEAGIVLLGTEVKSLREGRAEIGDAYVVPERGEMHVVNLKIDPYRNAGAFNHEERRPRKLLLHKREIVKLSMKINERGLTMVPLKLYFNQSGRVKLLLGLGRGKKSADRRQEEKRQEAKKEMARALRDFNRK